MKFKLQPKLSKQKLKLTSNSPPEDPAGCSEVVRSTRGVGVHSLAQESKVLHCRDVHLVRQDLIRHVLFTLGQSKHLNYTVLMSQMVVHVRVFSWSIKLENKCKNITDNRHVEKKYHRETLLTLVAVEVARD